MKINIKKIINTAVSISAIFCFLTLFWMVLEIIFQGELNPRRADAVFCYIISFFIYLLIRTIKEKTKKFEALEEKANAIKQRIEILEYIISNRSKNEEDKK